jgi:putative tryptophan/tyrosine transport system substrate-binding protein
MDRRTFIGSVALGIAAAPFAALSQQQLAKVHRIGFLGVQSASDYVTRLDALRTDLRELGYVETRNVVIEFRWAEGKYDRLSGLAAELIGLKVPLLNQHPYGRAIAPEPL